MGIEPVTHDQRPRTRWRGDELGIRVAFDVDIKLRDNFQK